VIMFYQFGKLIDEFKSVTSVQLETSKILYKTFGDIYINGAINGTGGSGLIPA